jgi:hypothetical protein
LAVRGVYRRRWFVRLAHDPKQNFGSDDVTRLALGMRF